MHGLFLSTLYQWWYDCSSTWNSAVSRLANQGTNYSSAEKALALTNLKNSQITFTTKSVFLDNMDLQMGTYKCLPTYVYLNCVPTGV